MTITRTSISVKGCFTFSPQIHMLGTEGRGPRGTPTCQDLTPIGGSLGPPLPAAQGCDSCLGWGRGADVLCGNPRSPSPPLCTRQGVQLPRVEAGPLPHLPRDRPQPRENLSPTSPPTAAVLCEVGLRGVPACAKEPSEGKCSCQGYPTPPPGRGRCCLVFPASQGETPGPEEAVPRKSFVLT